MIDLDDAQRLATLANDRERLLVEVGDERAHSAMLAHFAWMGW